MAGEFVLGLVRIVVVRVVAAGELAPQRLGGRAAGTPTPRGALVERPRSRLGGRVVSGHGSIHLSLGFGCGGRPPSGFGCTDAADGPVILPLILPGDVHWGGLFCVFPRRNRRPSEPEWVSAT